MNDIRKAVSSTLKKYRKERELTQVAFAEKLGYSAKTIAQWEQCNADVPVEILIMIRNETGKTLDEIYGLPPIHQEPNNNCLIEEYSNDESVIFERYIPEECIDKKYTVEGLKMEMMVFLGIYSPFCPLKFNEEKNEICIKNAMSKTLSRFLLRKKLISYTYIYDEETAEYKEIFYTTKLLAKLILKNYISNCPALLEEHIGQRGLDDIAKAMSDDLENANKMLEKVERIKE